MLHLPENLETEGDCFQKCLQIVGRMSNTGLNNYELLGCVYALNSEYKKLDIQANVMPEEEGTIYVNGMSNVIKTINAKLPVDLTNKFFSSEEDGIEKIKESLSEGIPVIAGVNPYYFYFMDDYLKNPGGFFKAYHITLVIGLNEEKEEIILSDPWLDFKTVPISYKEFFLAMTYGEGIENFRAYSYYEFRINTQKNRKKIKSICIEMAIENIEKMLGQGADNKNTGIPSLMCICKDLRYILECDIENINFEKYFVNLFNSIFHKLSWGRKFFALALSSEKFSDLSLQYEYVRSFEKFFNDWKKIAQVILVNKKLVSKKRIEFIELQISKLLEEELCKAEELKKDLEIIKENCTYKEA